MNKILTPLQTKLLEMFEWLTKYLDENDIRYYMMGGTALGAARHQGFIPWDDDIDICIPRKDYERLILMLKKPIEHYVIETYEDNTDDFLYNFAKFYDINTTMTEELRSNITRGVYIDIFPLDGLGNSYEEAIRTYKKIDRLNMLLATMTCKYRSDRKWWKNLSIFVGRLIPISPKYLICKVQKLCQKKDFDDYKYVTNCMSTYRTKEILEKSILGSPTLYKFEGIEAKAPENIDAYLSSIYNNWRQLPPLEKQHSAHDFIKIDLNKPYRTI